MYLLSALVSLGGISSVCRSVGLPIIGLCVRLIEGSDANPPNDEVSVHIPSNTEVGDNKLESRVSLFIDWLSGIFSWLICMGLVKKMYKHMYKHMYILNDMPCRTNFYFTVCWEDFK